MEGMDFHESTVEEVLATVRISVMLEGQASRNEFGCSDCTSQVAMWTRTSKYTHLIRTLRLVPGVVGVL